MKKNFSITSFGVLLTILFFSGCQKNTEQLIPGNDLQDPTVAANSSKTEDNQCRLRRWEESTGLVYDFHYNNKGLADLWRLDYGGGDFEEHHIKYDNKNRIKSTHIIAPVVLPGDAINYTFYNNGNVTTRATGYLESGGIWADIFYTYNNKGQMIKEDDNVSDYHTRFYYDNKGFNSGYDFYIGSEIVYKVASKFNISNRNPYLAIPGVDYGFPSFTWPLFDKRWNSSQSIIFYDEGVPYVIYEDDPSQTIMQTGNSNYLTFVHYFDQASETTNDITITYQNCDGRNDDNANMPAPSPLKNSGQISIKNELIKILCRHSGNIKQELKTFSRQYAKQLNQKG
jgi:hypothetical protein